MYKPEIQVRSVSEDSFLSVFEHSHPLKKIYWLMHGEDSLFLSINKKSVTGVSKKKYNVIKVSL